MSQILKQAIGDTRTHQIPMALGGEPFEPGDEWGLIFTAKLDEDDDDEDAVFQKASGAGITVSESVASVQVLPNDTAPTRPNRLYWDIQAQEISTGAIRTVAIGTMRLEGDVTRSITTSIPIITTQAPYPSMGGGNIDGGGPDSVYSADTPVIDGGEP